ncbi:MAG: SGNH/GDSL hydrolase family protein [Hydrococcus sp. Prado102]|jgi:phospholipase/lecithinase/hemolysin|nr:SGNH/GDSL hydrolase family protein [Hydrococcus sp. Prado102]
MKIRQLTAAGKQGIAIASTAIAIGSLTVMPVEAANLNFDGMYVVGGSLSDVNNTLNISGGTFPISPFFARGRLSNGKVWVEYLAKDLGLNLTPVTEVNPFNPPKEGINFAFGGATTGDKNINPLAPGMQQQFESFVGLLQGQSLDPNALYIVDGAAAANDYLGGFAKTPDQPVRNILNYTRQLADSGARNILVVNMPDIGQTPLGRQIDPVTLGIISRMHNRALSRGLKKLEQIRPETNFISFDLNGLFQQAIADPKAFGIKNITGTCTNTNLYNPSTTLPLDPSQLTICKKPKNFLFWDSIHPTTHMHKIIADSAYDVLSQELSEKKISALSATTEEVSDPEEISVPEPNSVLGLLAFGIIGTFSFIKHRFKRAEVL